MIMSLSIFTAIICLCLFYNHYLYFTIGETNDNVLINLHSYHLSMSILQSLPLLYNKLIRVKWDGDNTMLSEQFQNIITITRDKFYTTNVYIFIYI